MSQTQDNLHVMSAIDVAAANGFACSAANVLVGMLDFLRTERPETLTAAELGLAMSLLDRARDHVASAIEREALVELRRARPSS